MICRPGLWAGSRLKPAVQSRAEPEPSRRLIAAYGSGFEFGKPFSQAQAQAWVLLGRSPWLRLQAAGRRSHYCSECLLIPSQQGLHSTWRRNNTLTVVAIASAWDLDPLIHTSSSPLDTDTLTLAENASWDTYPSLVAVGGNLGASLIIIYFGLVQDTAMGKLCALAFKIICSPSSVTQRR